MRDYKLTNNTMTNKTRYIPKDFKPYTPDLGDYPKDLFACYVNLEIPAAIFYTKKQSNHTWFNRFLTVDDMKQKINTTISNLMHYEDLKVESAAKRKAPTALKVGDILYTSWGYDQTNVNFYKVTKLIGKQTVELREIGSKVVSDNGPETHVTADPDRFVSDKVITRRAPAGGYVHITSYATGWLWDGKPKYETGMGYGH